MSFCVRGLYKEYKNAETGIVNSVLNNVNLRVERGRSLAVTGPSGSGKSTLLRICGLLDEPDSGEVLLDNVNIHSKRGEERDYFRNVQMGFVFQNHLLLPQCNVIENITLPVLPQKPDRKKFELLRERGRELLVRVGLEDKIYEFPDRLSGGECQRVALVRSLINSPSLILADEPTGSLDKGNSTELADMLVNMNREENNILVVVTHSEALAQSMDKVFDLNRVSAEER